MQDVRIPKILFINSTESDGVQDLIYSGLVKKAGVNNIIDYPWNVNYHLPLRKYPANLGYVRSSLLKSFRYKSDFKKINAVVVSSAKPETFKYYLTVLNFIPSDIPVFFLDGGDYRAIGGDMNRLGAPELFLEAVSQRKFDGIFKREYFAEDNHPGNVWPLPICFNFDRLPKHLPDKLQYEVSFWAVESNPIRTKALTMLENKFDCSENGTVRNQVFKKYKRRGMYYLQELAACKIVLNFEGVGVNTHRYWEVPALGRFMISTNPRIIIPDNFVDNVHVKFCKDDLSDLIDLCEYYLKNEEEREAIAKQAGEHARKFHSNVARAEFIVEKIKSFL